MRRRCRCSRLPACVNRIFGGAREAATGGKSLPEALVAVSATCCGFAGREFDAHLCSNRTCEIGLQQGTGRTYESLVFALEDLSRPGRPAR